MLKSRVVRVGVGSSLFLAAALLSGCGGSNNSTEPDTPTISVSLNPTSGSVSQGASLAVGVTVTGAGGFTGTATVSLQSAPSGVTGTAGNIQSNAGTTTADLTIGVAGNVAPGNYTLTIRATGTGVAAATASYALTVTAAPTYTLSATPSALIVEQGASGTVTLSLGRTNYTEAVDLSLEGAPAGVTGSFSIDPVSGTASVLTIDVGGSVTPGGPYTLTIRGTSASLADRTVTVALTVTAPAVPDYLLAVTPSALTINLGGSSNAAVDITRSNFSAAVTLTAEGVPTDVSVAFAANPVAGNSTTMTVTVAGTVATGDYGFTVRGTATGLADKTVNITLTVASPAAYTLTVDPGTISLEQGTSGTLDVTLSRTNYTEAVTLSLEGAPAGVTGSFSINPVSGAASLLTLDVGGSVAAGDYGLTVRGTSVSLADQTFGVLLTVTEPVGFSLASIAGVSIQQGASGVRAVTINRTGGFAADVTVTVDGLAAGITASVSPVTTAGTSVDVTVNVAGSVSPGAYTATVHGNATAQTESTQTLNITVTQASGQQFTLDFSVCAASDRPVWFAFKDGAGPWTPVTGANDSYTFSVTSNSVGIAGTTLPNISESEVSVYYVTQTDLTTFGISELCDVASGKSVSATVAGINQANFEGAALTLGTSFLYPVTANGAVTFTDVLDGNLDLVGFKTDLAETSHRMLIMRDLSNATGTIGTVDFASGFDAISATITAPVGAQVWSMEYATSPAAGACYYAPLQSGAFSGGNTFTAWGATGAQQQAGDVHYVTVTTTTPTFSTVSEAFVALSNRTIAPAPALPVPTITDLTGSAAYKRARAELTLPAGYDDGVTVALVNLAGDRAIWVTASPGWLGGSAVSLDVPDFTGVAGWVDTWAPAAVNSADWILQAFGFSGTECTDGNREFTSFQGGTLP